MKVRSHKKPQVHVVTLGCSKNVVDSETLMGQLKANNMKVVHEDAQAESDIVIKKTRPVAKALCYRLFKRTL
jgi:ribosomal protein S12 methylthiotransferase